MSAPVRHRQFTTAGESIFTGWRRNLSAADDKITVFREAAFIIGLHHPDKPEAVDTLIEMACAHGFFGVGEQQIEAIIGEQMTRAKGVNDRAAASYIDEIIARWEAADMHRTKPSEPVPNLVRFLPKSTLQTAEYLALLGDVDRWHKWLAQHSPEERAAVVEYFERKDRNGNSPHS
jgi:hypothetical protein